MKKTTELDGITEYLPESGIIYHLNNGDKLLLFDQSFYRWDSQDNYWEPVQGFILIPTSSISYVESEDLEGSIELLYMKRFIGDYYSMNNLSAS